MTTLYKACQFVRIMGTQQYFSVGADSLRSIKVEKEKEVCSGENESGIAAREDLRSLLRGECSRLNDCYIDYLSDINVTSREDGALAQILQFFGLLPRW